MTNVNELVSFLKDSAAKVQYHQDEIEHHTAVIDMSLEEVQAQHDILKIPFEIWSRDGLKRGAKWLRKNLGYKHTTALRYLERAYPEIPKTEE